MSLMALSKLTTFIPAVCSTASFYSNTQRIKTLGVKHKAFESESAVVSGNHIMGSVPRHPIWEGYLRRVVEVQAQDPGRAVVKHTGNVSSFHNNNNNNNNNNKRNLNPSDSPIQPWPHLRRLIDSAASSFFWFDSAMDGFID